MCLGSVCDARCVRDKHAHGHVRVDRGGGLPAFPAAVSKPSAKPVAKSVTAVPRLPRLRGDAGRAGESRVPSCPAASRSSTDRHLRSTVRVRSGRALPLSGRSGTAPGHAPAGPGAASAPAMGLRAVMRYDAS